MTEIGLVYIGSRGNAERYAKDNCPWVKGTEILAVRHPDELAALTLPPHCHIATEIDKGAPVLPNAAEIFSVASARRVRPDKAGA